MDIKPQCARIMRIRTARPMHWFFSKRFSAGTATLAALFALLSCSKPSDPATGNLEIEGTTGQRVSQVSALLAKHHALPSPLQEARFLEEQTGDGKLGPSDFASFYALQIAPEDREKWTAILEPLRGPPPYVAPRQACDWWVPREDFARLKFFNPKPLCGTENGWIGVSASEGRIFIHTFTM